MGRKRERSGVIAVSQTSIQITFTFKGVLCRERIKLNPTPANLKRAELHRAAILHAIQMGTFDYGVTFLIQRKSFYLAKQKEMDTVLKTGWKHGLTGKKHSSKRVHGTDIEKSFTTYLFLNSVKFS